MRYFIIAGEASGDLHGSNLIRGLLKADKDAEIFFYGGDRMREAGGTLLSHYRNTAVMGYVEVVMRLGTVLGSLRRCRRDIRSLCPDMIILIDFPGFNMKMAKFARTLGIPVVYYISPKIWAWKRWRIKAIRRDVSRMYIILPFEKDFYDSYNFDTHYFGNPLVDEIDRYHRSAPSGVRLRESLGLDERPVISLFPGSRRDEVRRILPPMLSVIKYYPDYQFLIAASDSVASDLYQSIAGSYDVKPVFNRSYDLLALSEVAVVKSGTSTLEAALMNVPQIVCYKVSPISFLIGKMLIRGIRFVSLVNLLMDKQVVKELLQGQMKERNLVNEINSIITGGWKRHIMKNNYATISSMMCKPGVSDRVAGDIVKYGNSLQGVSTREEGRRSRSDGFSGNDSF